MDSSAASESSDCPSPRSLITEVYLKEHHAVFLTSSVLSTIGCLFIIGSFLKWRAIRTPSRSILVFISIADLLVVTPNISGVFSPYSNSTAGQKIQSGTDCRVAAAVNTFGNISSMLWTVALAVYLHSAIVMNNVAVGNQLIRIVFTPLCWGIPAVVTIVGAQQHALGFDEDYLTSGWCWVKVTDPNNLKRSEIAWMFVAGKAWEIAADIIIAALYISISFTIQRQVSRYSSTGAVPSEVEAMRKARKKMMLIPVVFVLLRFWGTLRLFWLLISPKTVCKNETLLIALLFLQAVGDTGQGWANCLLYGCLTQKVRVTLKRYMRMECICHPCKYKGDDLPSLKEESEQVFNAVTSSTKDNWITDSQSLPRPSRKCN